MRGRPVLTFLLDLVGMIIAIAVGMMTLFPLWQLAIRGAAPTSWFVQIETQSLVMAATMALPLVAWLRIRRHPWRPTLELALAVFAGFVVLFPFYWAGGLSAGQVMLLGHVLMVVFLLAGMLLRRAEYTGARSRPPTLVRG